MIFSVLSMQHRVVDGGGLWKGNDKQNVRKKEKRKRRGFEAYPKKEIAKKGAEKEKEK
jgi:hypothetical protein